MAWWSRKPRPEPPPIAWHPLFAEMLEHETVETVLERLHQPVAVDDGVVALRWPS